MTNFEQKKPLQVSKEETETLKELGREIIKKMDPEQAGKIAGYCVFCASLYLGFKELLKSFSKKAA
jgi:hypothetical protein